MPPPVSSDFASATLSHVQDALNSIAAAGDVDTLRSNYRGAVMVTGIRLFREVGFNLHLF